MSCAPVEPAARRCVVCGRALDADEGIPTSEGPLCPPDDPDSHYPSEAQMRAWGYIE